MLTRLKNKIISILNFFGIDIKKNFYLKNIPLYLSSLYSFMKMGGKINSLSPYLTDFGSTAGSSRGHYFHQDLIIASSIYNNKPLRHVDVGSRIDGFVAHVASFRKIEVIDIRHLSQSPYENIKFVQANIMDLKSVVENSTDSLSCLHAIEHFGLGRYGDPLNPDGHKIGFINLINMLKPNGILYISFPIANTSKVIFNAHRIFSPTEIMKWPNSNQLELINFDMVDDEGCLHRSLDIYTLNHNLKYGCGIYTFKKKM